MVAAVGKGGQNCDQVCAGLGVKRSAAASAGGGGGGGGGRSTKGSPQAAMICDVELLPLVNPREPSGDSPFCGGAFHPFLLAALAPHLPRTASSKLMHDNAAIGTAAAVVVRLPASLPSMSLMWYPPAPRAPRGLAASYTLHAVLCCAVLCCAVLCCAVLCCAVLCCTQPCKANEELGYPALVKESGAAGKRLWSTNYRLLNCSARLSNPSATRVCSCVDGSSGGVGRSRTGK
jgi:hypothetical protein